MNSGIEEFLSPEGHYETFTVVTVPFPSDSLFLQDSHVNTEHTYYFALFIVHQHYFSILNYDYFFMYPLHILQFNMHENVGKILYFLFRDGTQLLSNSFVEGRKFYLKIHQKSDMVRARTCYTGSVHVSF